METHIIIIYIMSYPDLIKKFYGWFDMWNIRVPIIK